ncbi:hypothetical protein N7527_006491 [Penicillium freii]|nr:hypothetical protein N7527_006491 [Penicillium freii]
MADAVDSESEGDNSTLPRPPVAPRTTGVSTNPIDPNEIDSDTILSKRIGEDRIQLAEIEIKKYDAMKRSDYSSSEPRDKTDTKDKDATVSESNNDDASTTVKKKRRGLRKQPPDSKDIHKYAREMRGGTQKDENNTMCSFYGFGPYPAKRCLLDTGSDKTLMYNIEDFYTY